MISVFTPTHNLCWLHEAYASLCSQTRGDWEWIIIPNGAARGYLRGFNDTRVRVINCPPEIDGKIGPLKKFACAQARGVAVLELDHDDILLPEAIAEAEIAFADETVDFAYSNAVNHDFRVDYPMTWNGTYGWTHRPFSWQGRWMLESVNGAPNPANFSRIWYAPNHFRAWRKTFYDRIGGHNAAMTAGDDHELVCRSYIEGGCRHIDKPLYIYRVNGENSWLKHQEEIQKVQWQNHDTYIEAMVAKWCRENGGLKRIAIGEPNPTDGYEFESWRLPLHKSWHFSNSTLGAIRATNVFQFIDDPVHVMNEAYRALAHGGWMFITVPSSTGLGAHDHPLNRSFWNSRSFRYYTEKDMQKLVPGLKCRFQKVKCDTVRTAEGVDYVVAHLVAVKEESPRFYGELLI
jgi:glycosyltransferase involved in cell wall biosynthesis